MVDINVEQYNMQDDQLIVATVPVPQNMNFHEVQDHLQQVAKAFKSEFDRTQKKPNLFIFPMNPDGLAPKFQVVPPLEEGSTIVLHVPVSGLKAAEIAGYLKTVKESFLLNWDEKFPGVKLEMFGIMDDGKQVELNIR